MKGSDKILIYSDINTPRLGYILDLLIKQIGGLDYELMSDKEAFNEAALPKLNYSREFVSSVPSIYRDNLLAKSALEDISLRVGKWKGFPVFFTTEENKSDLPFDPFAMSFYLVTRYEEYFPNTRDRHNRFEEKNSGAYRYGFHNRPLVNMLVSRILGLLRAYYPDLRSTENEYSFLPTYDIDMAFAHKNKELKRIAGGYVKMLLGMRFRDIWKRTAVISGLLKDPFDNFDMQARMHQKYGLEARYFVNVGDHSKFDKNNPWTDQGFVQLVKKLALENAVGLHPSYYSYENPDKIKTEKERLEKITGKEIQISRQHFLKIEFPSTYNQLLNAGIKHDYSMGYATMAGFRASVCTPFRFFDLSENTEKDLMIHPFAFMDTMFHHYMKLNYNEILEEVRCLIDITRDAGGQLCGIWHNYFLSDNPERIKSYQEILKLASE